MENVKDAIAMESLKQHAPVKKFHIVMNNADQKTSTII